MLLSHTIGPRVKLLLTLTAADVKLQVDQNPLAQNSPTAPYLVFKSDIDMLNFYVFTISAWLIFQPGYSVGL